MYFVVVTYKKPIEVVEQFLQAHIAFLDQNYESGKFIFSGRRIPRTGGVILANVDSKGELDTIIQQDPFYTNEIADYDVIEFLPTKYDPRFGSFVHGA